MLLNIFKTDPVHWFMLALSIIRLFFLIIEFNLLKWLVENKFLEEDYLKKKKKSYILKIVFFCALIAIYVLKILYDLFPENYFEEELKILERYFLEEDEEEE